MDKKYLIQPNSGKPRRTTYVYDTSMNLLTVHPSSADAARKYGVSQGNVSLCCRGGLETVNGFIFSYEYLENNLQRIYELQDGEDLHEDRLKAVNKAVHKYTSKNPEAARERARRYYEIHKQAIKERREKKKDDSRG